MAILHLLCGLQFFVPASALKEHGIVYPALVDRRSVKEERVLKINEHIILNLKKSTVLAGDFLFRSEKSNEEVHYYMKQHDYEKDLYHDDLNMASVIVNTDNGVKVEGILSNTLRVEPMLEMARSQSGRIPHRLYEINPPEQLLHQRDPRPANITETNQNISLYLEARRSRRTRYAEIHLVVDHAFASAYKFNKAKITIYFIILLNACNLRFKTLLEPRIRLRIVGISMFTEEAPFMVRPRENRGLILDEETLAAFNEHYKGTDVYKHCDLLFLVSGEDMAFYDDGALATWTAGYTYVGGICLQERVGMCEEIPKSYHGAYVLSHEIAHALGCVHDGTGRVDLPGHMGALTCPAEDGFLMSYAKKDNNQFRFSECCRRDMENLFRRREWMCLTKRVKKSMKRRGLPGQYTSGETYCRSCYPNDVYMHYDRGYGVQDCHVRCVGTESVYLGVPDGTPCDKMKRGEETCRLGECLKEK